MVDRQQGTRQRHDKTQQGQHISLKRAGMQATTRLATRQRHDTSQRRTAQT